MTGVYYDTSNNTPQEKSLMSVRFDAKRLVDDLGGVRNAAEILGKSRTAPYRWMNTGYMSTFQMEQIKEIRPDINFDDYFENGDARKRVQEKSE